jgi:ankyrin repeat protein
MDRGSAVDAGNKGGWTALHRAAFTGRVPACRLLLRRGAGLNSITKHGRTALHLAALQVCSAYGTCMADEAAAGPPGIQKHWRTAARHCCCCGSIAVVA